MKLRAGILKPGPFPCPYISVCVPSSKSHRAFSLVVFIVLALVLVVTLFLVMLWFFFLRGR
jgi:hypothetical protein